MYHDIIAELMTCYNGISTCYGCKYYDKCSSVSEHNLSEHGIMIYSEGENVW